MIAGIAGWLIHPAGHAQQRLLDSMIGRAPLSTISRTPYICPGVISRARHICPCTITRAPHICLSTIAVVSARLPTHKRQAAHLPKHHTGSGQQQNLSSQLCLVPSSADNCIANVFCALLTDSRLHIQGCRTTRAISRIPISASMAAKMTAKLMISRFMPATSSFWQQGTRMKSAT